jgi:hypothetical protein
LRIFIPLLLTCLLLLQTAGYTEEASNKERKSLAQRLHLRKYPAPEDDGISKWYVNQGMMNVHPQLKIAEEMIDAEINQVLRSFASGFDDITTFSDQSDDFMIWSPFISVGRVLNKRWDVFLQVGYTKGEVQTTGHDPFTLAPLLTPLLTLHSDITLERSTFLMGLGVDFYPLGMPELRKFDSWGERFKGVKPYLSPTLNYSYLTYDADVRLTLGPALGAPYVRTRIQRDDSWKLWNIGLTAGLDIPVSKRSTLSVNGTVNFFFDQGEDFDGYSFTFFWKRFF